MSLKAIDLYLSCTGAFVGSSPCDCPALAEAVDSNDAFAVPALLLLVVTLCFSSLSAVSFDKSASCSFYRYSKKK